MKSLRSPKIYEHFDNDLELQIFLTIRRDIVECLLYANWKNMKRWLSVQFGWNAMEMWQLVSEECVEMTPAASSSWKSYIQSGMEDAGAGAAGAQYPSSTDPAHSSLTYER